MIFSTQVQAGSRSYRDFDKQTLVRLSLIKKGKAIGLSLKQIQPLLDAFLNQQMSQTQALEILTEQGRYMDRLIEQAQEVKTLIQQHCEKIEGKQPRTCDTAELLLLKRR